MLWWVEIDRMRLAGAGPIFQTPSYAVRSSWDRPALLVNRAREHAPRRAPRLFNPVAFACVQWLANTCPRCAHPCATIRCVAQAAADPGTRHSRRAARGDLRAT